MMGLGAGTLIYRWTARSTRESLKSVIGALNWGVGVSIMGLSC